MSRVNIVYVIFTEKDNSKIPPHTAHRFIDKAAYL